MSVDKLVAETLRSPLVRRNTLNAQAEIDISYRQRLRWVLSELGYEDQVVLDIGCGDGHLLEILPGSHQIRVGIDTSYSSLNSSNAKSVGANLVCASGLDLPFRDSVFDTVIMMEVLEHLAKPEVALEEARRVMRLESRLLVTVPSLNFPPAWDPISRTIKLLRANPLRRGMFAGFWYMHYRLYDVSELERELHDCFVPVEFRGLTHFFIPFYPYIVNLYANIVYHVTRSPFRPPWPVRVLLDFLDRRNFKSTGLRGATTLSVVALPRK